MKWKIFVGAAESGYEVVFECSNCPFCGIASMDMWWGKLKIDVLFSHEVLERSGSFIVKSLQLGAEAAFGEQRDRSLIGVQDVRPRARFHRLCMDIIAIIVIYH
jgi:hypothetical protein